LDDENRFLESDSSRFNEQFQDNENSDLSLNKDLNENKSQNLVEKDQTEDKEYCNLPWKEDNIQTFLNLREREIKLGMNLGGIRSN
jgi:hypothetical protein